MDKSTVAIAICQASAIHGRLEGKGKDRAAASTSKTTTDGTERALCVPCPILALPLDPWTSRPRQQGNETCMIIGIVLFANTDMIA